MPVEPEAPGAASRVRGDRVIEFFYDFISPNVYLAWTRLVPLAAQYGYRITPVAVLFAGILKKYGQLGPAEVVPKAQWMARNILRKAALTGTPLNPPRHHPFNPLLPLRVACAAGPDERRLIGPILRAVWVERVHVSEADVLRRVIDRAGFAGAALLARAATPEARQTLRRRTEEAIERGVFGVPTMCVADEVFWGYDDLVFLEQLLAGRDPLDRVRYAEWLASVTPSATRTR